MGNTKYYLIIINTKNNDGDEKKVSSKVAQRAPTDPGE